MGWIRRIDAIGWIAVACVLVAIVAAIVYITTKSLDDWAPNIATEAVSIAITVGVVAWIIGRERRRRTNIMLASAYDALASAFVRMGIAAAQDYSETHSDATYVEPPEEVDRLLEHWAREVVRADAFPETVLDDLLTATTGCAEAINQILIQNATVLNHEYVSTDLILGLREVSSSLSYTRIFGMIEDLDGRLSLRDQHTATVQGTATFVRRFLPLFCERAGISPQLPPRLHASIRADPDRRYIRPFPPGL